MIIGMTRIIDDKEELQQNIYQADGKGAIYFN